MTKEKIFIKSKNGNKLACLVAEPEGKADGLVISSQGFGSTKEKPTYKNLLSELSRFVVVVFEYQGLGESEGDFKEKTVTRDLEDLRAVLDYSYNLFKFDKEKLFIFGSSFGGFTALNLALEDDRIKGLVLKCPVSNFRQVYAHLKNHPKYVLYYDTFLEDGKKYDIYSRASKLNIPVKIIHGNKDVTVSIEQSIKLVKLSPNAELKIIEGEGHAFENTREEINSLLIKFLEVLK